MTAMKGTSSAGNKQTNKQTSVEDCGQKTDVHQKWPQLPLYFTGNGLKIAVGMKQDTLAGLLPCLSAVHCETPFSE